MIRKFISEFVGTLLLVFFGCGTATAVNQYVTSIYGISLPFTMLIIAVAFGLVLVAVAYTIGRVSGAHVNPAVSVAALIDGRITVFECVYYVIGQLFGAIAGAAALQWIFGSTSTLGANGYEGLSALSTITTAPVAFVIETILTFVFVLVVLSVTKKENCNSGLIIGLTLTLVHIMGIPFTGTSVNPARSIGPALFVKGTQLEQLWLFILAPLLGAVLAALFYRFVIDPKEKADSYVLEVDEEIEESEETEEPEDDDEIEEDNEEPEEEKVEESKPTKKKTTKKNK